MKFIKMLSLAATAAVALLAFAGSASATTITSPSGTVYTSTVKDVSEGAVKLSGSFTTIQCNASAIEGKIEKHGSGVTAAGAVSSMTFTECNFPVTVAKKGSLEVHATSGSNGTLTSSGAEISIATSIGTCVFTTSNTNLGTVTGSSSTGGAATKDISGSIPRTGGNFLCGSSGTLTGSYKGTTPSVAYVDA
jgi:hypothetical protein